MSFTFDEQNEKGNIGGFIMIQVAFNNAGVREVSGEPGPGDLVRHMKQGVEPYVQAAADLGFKAFQLNTGYDGLFPTTESFEGADTAAIRQKLEDSGIELNLHHHGQNVCPDAFAFAAQKEVYTEFGAYLEAAIQFMQAVGGSVITFHPPFLDNGLRPEERPMDPDTRAEAIRAFDRLVRALGERAAEADVLLGIESVVWGPPGRPWTTIFVTPEELDQFVKAPGFPDSVGILAEISHLHHMAFDIGELLRLWDDKVFEIHASDSVVHQWTDKKHYSETLRDETHRAVGEGTLDFPAAIRALQELGRDVWLSLEIHPLHVKGSETYISSREILEGIVAASAKTPSKSK